MKRNIQHRNTQQRRHAIMQLLQEQGEVSVEQLVQLFDTSEVTIRKDLTALESNGFLLRKIWWRHFNATRNHRRRTR